MKKKLLTFACLAALLLVGCSSEARVGALQNEFQSVEVGNAESVQVDINFGAGDLKVSGEAEKLLEAEFTYNVAKLKPEVEFTDGTLVVQHPDVRGYRTLQDITDFRNEWDLRLNNEIPMNLRLDMGAGTSDLQLASLSLTGLDVNLGAGKSTIDLRGDRSDDLEANIEIGAADITVWLPKDIGVRVEIEAGPTVINASGLTKDGNIYTNTAYGISDISLQIKITSGIGFVNLKVEE